MKKTNKILAVIPARGNSKALPGKNIKPLCGKPMLAWTIEAMLSSGVDAKIIVSTDDAKIAEVAKSYKIEAMPLRPKSLSTDTAPSNEVLLYEIERLGKAGETFDIVIKLQPTSPLREGKDIYNAVSLFSRKKAQAIVSVSLVGTHPYWMNTLPTDGNMSKFIRPEALSTGRQKLPVFYRLNGAVYISQVERFKECRSFFSKGTYAYVMPQERSVDVDTELDFKTAEVNLGSKLSR